MIFCGPFDVLRLDFGSLVSNQFGPFDDLALLHRHSERAETGGRRKKGAGSSELFTVEAHSAAEARKERQTAAEAERVRLDSQEVWEAHPRRVPRAHPPERGPSISKVVPIVVRVVGVPHSLATYDS